MQSTEITQSFTPTHYDFADSFQDSNERPSITTTLLC